MQPNYQLIAYELNVADSLDTARIYNAILELKQQLIYFKGMAENLTTRLASQMNELDQLRSDDGIQKQIIYKFEQQCQLADKKIQEQGQLIYSANVDSSGYKELLQLRLQNDDLKHEIARLQATIAMTAAEQTRQSPMKSYNSPLLGQTLKKYDDINYKITIKQQLKQIQELERFKSKIYRYLETDVDESEDAILAYISALRGAEAAYDVEYVVSKAEALVNSNDALKTENAYLSRRIEQLSTDNRYLKALVDSGLEQIGRAQGTDVGGQLQQKQLEIERLQRDIQQLKAGQQKQPGVQISVFRQRVLDLIDDMRIERKSDFGLLRKQVSELAL